MARTSFPVLKNFQTEFNCTKYSTAILTNPVLLAELNERFDELLPKLLDFDNLKSDVKQDVLTRIKDQYFGGNLSICANSQRFVDVSNDNDNGLTIKYNFDHFFFLFI